MNINKNYLGSINGSDVFQYTLVNDLNTKVQILTLGASIQSIVLPFSDGTDKNVILSYDNWETYQYNPLYLGATLAPNAGRIEGGVLPVYKKTYALSQNEGNHNAHGGFHNASLQNWDEVSTHCNSDRCSVTLSIKLSDGLDGYPGERCIQTCYSLTNDNSLKIHYHAVTDKATYLNISNHTYFNLSGDFNRSGLEQQIKVDASQFVANNYEHIPDSIVSCFDSPFDFSIYTSLENNIALYPNHKQLSIAHGYNNAFIFDQKNNQVKKTLSLRDRSSEYIMELSTDAPGIVLYSGGYIGDQWSLAGGFKSSDSCAIALEAQDIPNSPNFLPEQCCYTTPDCPYDRTIIFKFLIN